MKGDSLMENNKRHLQGKIRFFEDLLLLSRDYQEQEKILRELTTMRIELQKMCYQKTSL